MGSDDGQASAPTLDEGGDVSLDAIPLHSTNLLTVLDSVGIVQYESPSIERVFGFDQDELVGEQVAAFFHPEDRETVVEAFETVVASDDYVVESVEYRHGCADGSYRWVESVAASDPTPGGNYVVNTRDVSDRKARERELERTNERLDEFASVLSHDLRNPLQVAEGHLELVDGDDDHLAAVERAHDRMRELIDDLLDVARDGAVGGDPAPVDLEALVTDCWRSVETEDATVAVETDAVVLADPKRLPQLFENLFRNSVEYADGTGTIEVATTAEGFYVEDDGPGIDPTVRDRVFERGYSGADGGIGIGLSIVERVSRAHGWEVSVTEGARGGARFEFTDVTFADAE